MKTKDEFLASVMPDQQHDTQAMYEAHEAANRREAAAAEAAAAVEAGPDYDVLLTRSEVEGAIRVSARTFERLVERGEFPASIRVSPGRIVWRKSEVRQYLAGRRDWGAF